MKAKVVRERKEITATLEKGQARMEAEANRADILERQRDQEKLKHSSLKRKLALMLAGEQEGEATKTKYASLKRNLLLMLAD